MHKRQTSVDVLASCGPAGAGSDACSQTVEVRKVENGYVKRESTWNGDEYSTRETIHSQNPGLTPGNGRAEGQSGRGTLRDAIKTCS